MSEFPCFKLVFQVHRNELISKSIVTLCKWIASPTKVAPGVLSSFHGYSLPPVSL